MKEQDSFPIIEAIPNISEGRDPGLIKEITEEISSVAMVQLLHVDMGEDAHRTVITYAGNPPSVLEATRKLYSIVSENIDMGTQHGAHPRIGAIDVCPFVPIRGITVEELIPLVDTFSKDIAIEHNLPVFLYEASANFPLRKNLSIIRSGEYEGLTGKLRSPTWLPDYGPSMRSERMGATVIGVRNFLIAYNINLNTSDIVVAKSIAKVIRTSGGKINGVHKPGLLSSTKAIGWYMDQYKCAQVSTNLTDYRITGMADVYNAISKEAQKYNVSVTGSELIGLVPLKAILDAGKTFASDSLSEEEYINLAHVSLGLSSVVPFNPEDRIIERLIKL